MGRTNSGDQQYYRKIYVLKNRETLWNFMTGVLIFAIYNV